MFEKVFRKDQPPEEEKRRLTIAMSSKKPITLTFISPAGEEVLLANETTSFRGEISVPEGTGVLQYRFEGENIRARKNAIRLEIGY